MVKLFTFLVIVFPITANYLSPIPEVELGTFCFLLLFPFMFIYCIKENVKIKILPQLLIILLYTFGSTLINLMRNETLYSEVSSILFRTMRFEFLLIAVMIIGISTWFDFNYAVKRLRTVTLLAVTYLIIQFITYSLTGFALPGFVEGITKMEWTHSVSFSEYDTRYRPTSFFLEPSSFVYYVTIYLTYCLFSNAKVEKRNMFEALYITIGIFFSTSGQGIFVTAVLWLVWSIKKLLKKEHKNNKIIFVCIVLPIMISLIVLAGQSDTGSYTISRFFSNDSEYTAIDARAGGYILYHQLSTASKIMGVGFGNYPNIYFSSFAEIIFTTGIIGAILTFNMYCWAFLKGQNFQKMLCISSFILMGGGGIYTATYLCIYLPFILFRFNNDKSTNKDLSYVSRSIRL